MATKAKRHIKTKSMSIGKTKRKRILGFCGKK